MARYNNTSLAFAEEEVVKDCFGEVESYLSSEGRYWLETDIWTASSGKFTERGIDLEGLRGDVIADFSTVPDGKLKTELKYHALWSLDMQTIAARTYAKDYRPAMMDIGRFIESHGAVESVTEESAILEELPMVGKTDFRCYIIRIILSKAKALLADVYDIRDEMEKDEWRALRIPGARLSAVQKRNKAVLRFTGIPDYYRGTVKRYFRRLVIKRSWSHCSEMLRYIKVFFKLFYENSYDDGFLKKTQPL